jgi:hypothetical protein
MRQSKAGFHQLAIDLIKEAELNSIGGVAPDRKVGSAICDGGAKGSRICRQHGRYLAVDRGKRRGF